MKVVIAILLLCVLDASNAQSECLAAAPSGSRLCFKVQNAGQDLASDIKMLDVIVQRTIYQSMIEASKMLASGMELLKRDITNLKIRSTGVAPIEQSTIGQLKASAESVARESVRTANKELQQEIRKAFQILLGDVTYSNNIIDHLGFTMGLTFTSSSSGTDDLGNSIDGAVSKVLPAVNQTLVKADMKVKVSFQSILDAFVTSIKQLLGGKTGISIDEAEKNMQKMIYHAAANLIESNVESAKNTITQSLTDLQEIAALASAYKSDSTKLPKILKPARILVAEAVAKTHNTVHDTLLTRRIDEAIATLKKYYEEIKNIVSA